MNRMELIARIAVDNDISAADAKRAVDMVIAGLEKGVAELEPGDQVVVNGFGAFAMSMRKARKGRNPQTGEVIDIPAARALKFKPATALKKAARC